MPCLSGFLILFVLFLRCISLLIYMFYMKNFILLFLFFCFISVSGQDKLELFFDFNKDVVNKNSETVFRNWLKSTKEVSIFKIEGYCDSVASNAYNLNLSTRRINAVLTMLKSSNLRLEDNVEFNAFGEDFEQSKNQSTNRKVILFYKYPKNPSEKPLILAAAPIIINKEEKEMGIQLNNSNLIDQLNNSKVGDLIQIDNLNFYFNSEKIVTESLPVLSNLLNALRINPQLKINIYGHICCNTNPNDVKLSYRRSKFVFDYLIKNGIATARLDHKGFGSSKPLYPLPEKNEGERVANRRVEILIIQK